MKSLRTRLTVVLSLILVAVFISLWIALSFAINKVAQDQLLTHLEHDGDALLSALSFDASGALVLEESGVEDVYRRLKSGHYFVVQASEGRRLSSRSLGNETLPVLMAAPQNRSHAQVVGPGGQSVLALTRGSLLQGRPISVTVGEDLTDMKEEMREQSFAALGLVWPLLLAAVVLQSLSIRRALRPLTGIQIELQMISKGEIDRIEGEVPTEITPLVDEINRLLKVVHRRLMQSRTAVGNLAHALKTPLAVLFRLADDQTLAPELRAELQNQTRLIRDKLERELKRARLAGGESFGSHVNLNTELQVMSRILNAIYSDKQLDIVIEAPDRPVPFDREDMLELLGNLADNACKWAQGRVLIRVITLNDFAGIQFRISDDGPGCSTEEAKLLVKRGLRLDESRLGHGLGLVICHDIVEFYGGHMSFDRDPVLGGLRVQVDLPKRV